MTRMGLELAMKRGNLEAAKPLSAETLLHAMEWSHRCRYASEPVSELEHALQCGELARREGADEDLVVAALLHDVGRYAVRQRLVRDTLDSKEMAKLSTDSRGHHDAGADLLAPWFPKRVVLCIRMHVDAKRYLCAVDPAYLERLSAVSARTLRMQGGAMDSEEIFEFEAHPLANEFIRLRLWDDQAKDPSMVTLPLTEWQPIIAGYFPS